MANLRCVYVVIPDDAGLSSDIRSNTLFADEGFAEDFVEFIYENDTISNQEQRELRRPADGRPEPRPLPNSSYVDVYSGAVSLTQPCDPTLEIGGQVVMTFGQDGGTTSRARTRSARTVGDVMRSEGALHRILRGLSPY